MFNRNYDHFHNKKRLSGEQTLYAYRMALADKQSRKNNKTTEQPQYIPGPLTPCIKAPRWLDPWGGELDNMITAYRTAFALENGRRTESIKTLERLMWESYETDRKIFQRQPFDLFILKNEEHGSSGYSKIELSLREALKHSRFYENQQGEPTLVLLSVKRNLYDHGYYRKLATRLGIYINVMTPWAQSPRRYLNVELSKDPTPVMWEKFKRAARQKQAEQQRQDRGTV